MLLFLIATVLWASRRRFADLHRGGGRSAAIMQREPSALRGCYPGRPARMRGAIVPPFYTKPAYVGPTPGATLMMVATLQDFVCIVDGRCGGVVQRNLLGSYAWGFIISPLPPHRECARVGRGGGARSGSWDRGLLGVGSPRRTVSFSCLCSPSHPLFYSGPPPLLRVLEGGAGGLVEWGEVGYVSCLLKRGFFPARAMGE